MHTDLQRLLEKAIEDAPRALLETLVQKKFIDAGVQPPEEAIRELVGALLAGETELRWNDDDAEPSDVKIALTEVDLKEFREALDGFRHESLPKLIQDFAHDTASGVTKTLKDNWPDRALWEEQELAGFQARLMRRWGAALNLLKMLLTISRELGEETYKKARRSRAKRNRYRRDALLRLHARACQVTGEIITLIESGYADGAMARWRTLHEIGVVIALIAEHGDELAERYLAHDIVESAHSLAVYGETHATLGYAPPPRRIVKQIEKLLEAAINTYGSEFGREYGWAAKHINRKKPTFRDLEAAAQKSRMRAHYRLACQSVHAGIKGITNPLSVLDISPMILSGPSNAGLDEPGQNGAITLTQITFALLGPGRKWDDVVMLMTLASLQDQAVKAFSRAGRQLKSEEKKRSKNQSVA